MTPATPKTYIHLARDAPVGVVLYRRSHLTTYVLKLDHKDRLIKGSRFYGRLFPERCDISPDGKLFVYFAMRGKRTGGNSDPATWTAISEPPSLQALVFCPNGSTWGGGGVFLPRRRLILFEAPPNQTEVRGYSILPDLAHTRDGDFKTVEERMKPPKVKAVPQPILTHLKKPPFLIRHLKPHVASGYDKFDYVLRHPDDSDFEGAEEIVLANWAGWDFQGRLVAAFGRVIKVYDVRPGKPLNKPVKTLDIEAAIA